MSLGSYRSDQQQDTAQLDTAIGALAEAALRLPKESIGVPTHRICSANFANSLRARRLRYSRLLPREPIPGTTLAPPSRQVVASKVWTFIVLNPVRRLHGDRYFGYPRDPEQ